MYIIYLPIITVPPPATLTCSKLGNHLGGPTRMPTPHHGPCPWNGSTPSSAEDFWIPKSWSLFENIWKTMIKHHYNSSQPSLVIGKSSWPSFSVHIRGIIPPGEISTTQGFRWTKTHGSAQIPADTKTSAEDLEDCTASEPQRLAAQVVPPWWLLSIISP